MLNVKCNNEFSNLSSSVINGKYDMRHIKPVEIVYSMQYAMYGAHYVHSVQYCVCWMCKKIWNSLGCSLVNVIANVQTANDVNCR